MDGGLQKETSVNCVICKHDEAVQSKITVTLNRESLTLVVKEVPALVCNNCGEEYVDEDVSAQLLETAEEALHTGVEVDIRVYRAA